MRNKSSMRPPKVIPTALPGRVCAKSNILLAKCTPGHECKRIDLGFKSKSQISKCVQSRRATGFRRKEIKMTPSSKPIGGDSWRQNPNLYRKEIKKPQEIQPIGGNSWKQNPNLYRKEIKKPQEIQPIGAHSWKRNPNLYRKEIKKPQEIQPIGAHSWKRNPNLYRKEIKKPQEIQPIGGDSWKQNPNLYRKEIKKPQEIQPIGGDSWKQNPNLHRNRKRATGLIDLSAKKGEICYKPARSAGQIVMAPKRCEHGYVCRQSDEDELMRLPTPSFCLKPKKRATGLLMPDKELELPELNLDIQPLQEKLYKN